MLPTLLASRYFLCSFLLHRFLLRCPARICRSANLQNACLAARCQFRMISRLVRLQVARKYWSLGPALTSTLDGTRNERQRGRKGCLATEIRLQNPLAHNLRLMPWSRIQASVAEFSRGPCGVGCLHNRQPALKISGGRFLRHIEPYFFVIE